MARFRPVGPPTASKDRQPMKRRNEAAAAAVEFGEDPWVLAARRNASKELSTATSSTTAEAPVKHQEPDDSIALPTPIGQGLWKVTAPDGREELTYKPIRGFEHLLAHGPDASQGLPSSSPSPNVTQASQQATVTQAPDTPQRHNITASKQKPPKRRRPVARGVARQRRDVRVNHETEDIDGPEDDDSTKVINEVTHSFYVGDILQLKKFFRRRLDELTMKPLRPIVTAWIKQLEPKRLGAYGPYHKQFPADMPPESTPRWWPQDVPYEEPSHLCKSGLLTLAVDVMLQHRIIDEAKRRGSWVAKMRQAATYAVETTPPEHFSSAKRVAFSEQMRDRALNEILPTLFDAAQSYEDHFAQYNLYEGSGNVDPGNGTQIYWQAATRPSRISNVKKRERKIEAKPAPSPPAADESTGDETEVDDTISNSFLQRGRDQTRKRPLPASGDETEIDETLSNSFVRKERSQARKRVQLSHASTNTAASPSQAPKTQTAAAAVPEPRPPRVQNPAFAHSAPQPSFCSGSSISTPNTSFDYPLNSLRPEQDTDLGMDIKHTPQYNMDVKHTPHAQYNMAFKADTDSQYNNQHLMCNIFPLSQPMQYSDSHPGYSNQAFQPQEHMGTFPDGALSPFTSAQTSGFVPQFPLYPTSYSPHMDNTAFAPQMVSNNSGFPYSYEGVFPSPPTQSNGGGSFNGLPADRDINAGAPHHP